jgi:hypothetical protein
VLPIIVVENRLKDEEISELVVLGATEEEEEEGEDEGNWLVEFDDPNDDRLLMLEVIEEAEGEADGLMMLVSWIVEESEDIELDVAYDDMLLSLLLLPLCAAEEDDWELDVEGAIRLLLLFSDNDDDNDDDDDSEDEGDIE